MTIAPSRGRSRRRSREGRPGAPEHPTLAVDADSFGSAAETVELVLEPDDLPHALLDLHRAVSQAVLHGACRVVVDAARVDCLSSTTITALLWAQRRCRARGGGVVLRNPSARSVDLIIRTGLWDVVEVEAGGPRRGSPS